MVMEAIWVGWTGSALMAFRYSPRTHCLFMIATTMVFGVGRELHAVRIGWMSDVAPARIHHPTMKGYTEEWWWYDLKPQARHSSTRVVRFTPSRDTRSTRVRSGASTRLQDYEARIPHQALGITFCIESCHGLPKSKTERDDLHISDLHFWDARTLIIKNR